VAALTARQALAQALALSVPDVLTMAQAYDAAGLLLSKLDGWQLVDVARLAQAITESGEPRHVGIWWEAEALMAALESQQAS
jgi:hypothetical protein